MFEPGVPHHKIEAFCNLSVLNRLEYTDKDIELETAINGAPVGLLTLFRVRKKTIHKSDLAGLCMLANKVLYDTPSGVGEHAMEGERILRETHARGKSNTNVFKRQLARQALELLEGRKRLQREQAPVDEDQIDDRFKDETCLDNLEYRLDLYNRRYRSAYERSFALYKKVLAKALAETVRSLNGGNSSWPVSAFAIIATRAAVNCLFSASELGDDALIAQIAKEIATPEFMGMAEAVIWQLKDERIAANVIEAAALDNKPEDAAQFLHRTAPGEWTAATAASWKPVGWNQAVFDYPYMTETRNHFERLRPTP